MARRCLSGLLVASLIVTLAGASLTLACGADHADPPADETGGGGNEGGSGSDIRLPPAPSSGRCTTGAVEECTVYYKSGGVTNCFVGVQLCVEGTWDICTEQQNVDDKIAELGYDDLGGGGAGGSGS